MLQVVASPMIIILMTLEALMTVILATIESSTGLTYNHHNIAIVQATDLTMKFFTDIIVAISCNCVLLPFTSN
jgi:hypothetical protein